MIWLCDALYTLYVTVFLDYNGSESILESTGCQTSHCLAMGAFDDEEDHLEGQEAERCPTERQAKQRDPDWQCAA